MQLKTIYNFFKIPTRSNTKLKKAMCLFWLFLIIAIFAPIIANDRPLMCYYKGNFLFPAFSFKNQVIIKGLPDEIINYNMGKEWKFRNYEFAIFPPCAYSPNTIDAENAPRISPFEDQYINSTNGHLNLIPYKFRHWLGTTQNGNDVLACIIHGTRISLGIGIFSMIIAGFIGTTFGALAGYFENITFKIGIFQTIFIIIGSLLALFYSIYVRNYSLAKALNKGELLLLYECLISIIIFFSVIVVFNYVGLNLDRIITLPKTISLSIDNLISRIIEVLNSIPSLLLVVAISAIVKPSYTLLILLIGFLNWTSIARITRAEYLKNKQLNYVLACKAIGLSNYNIMFKHILPNVLPIIFVQIIFGMVGAILIEASLSFIGIGIPINIITWGSLLNEAKDHFSAWWLVLFPGLSLFVLVFTYNIIATEITKINNNNVIIEE